MRYLTILLAVMLAACGGDNPTGPDSVSFNGAWLTNVLQTNDGPAMRVELDLNGQSCTMDYQIQIDGEWGDVAPVRGCEIISEDPLNAKSLDPDLYLSFNDIRASGNNLQAEFRGEYNGGTWVWPTQTVTLTRQ